MIISAQYRFFIDVFLVFGFIILYKSWYAFGKISSLSMITIVLVFLAIPQVLQRQLPSFRIGNMMSGFYMKQVLLPSHFELNNYQHYKIGNLSFNISNNYPFNFDTPIPAISQASLLRYQKLGIFPQLIEENNLKSGFIWKSIRGKDRENLNKIILQLKLKEL